MISRSPIIVEGNKPFKQMIDTSLVSYHFEKEKKTGIIRVARDADLSSNRARYKHPTLNGSPQLHSSGTPPAH